MVLTELLEKEKDMVEEGSFWQYVKRSVFKAVAPSLMFFMTFGAVGQVYHKIDQQREDYQRLYGVERIVEEYKHIEKEKAVEYVVETAGKMSCTAEEIGDYVEDVFGILSESLMKARKRACRRSRRRRENERPILRTPSIANLKYDAYEDEDDKKQQQKSKKRVVYYLIQ